VPNEKRTLEISARLNDFVTKNLSRMQRGIQRFASVAGRAFRGLLTRINPLAIGITGFVSAWAAFRGGKTVVEILDGVDALDKLGDSMNTDVGRLALLRGAFEIAGVSGDKFADIMKTVGTIVGSVLDRNDANLIEGLERLGVTADDLREKDMVGIFEGIAGGLEQYNTAQERAAALSRFFPENFQPLFAVLAKGQDEFRNLIALSDLFVGTIGEDGAKAAGRFATAMGLLKTTVESVGRDALIVIAERFAPSIERIATFLATNRTVIAEGLAAIITAVVKTVAVIGSAVLQILAFLVARGDELIEKLRELPIIGELIGDALSSVFDVPELNEQAKAIRDRATEIADELLYLEQRIAEIGRNPREFDASGTRLQAYQDQARELRNELAELRVAFQEVAPGAGDVADSARSSASLRQMSELLKQLANFEDLPGLPSQFEGLLRQLLGPDDLPEIRQDIGDFFRGFGDQVEQIRRKWSDFSQAGRDAAVQLVDNGLNGVADAFADIITRTKSAKEAFKELARSLLSDLARIIARLVIVRAVSSLFNYGSSNVQAQEKGGVIRGQMGKPVKLEAFERGGIARGPTLALFGEGRASKGEAFVPLPDGRTIPVTLAGGGGGGPSFTFNINAVDGASVRRMLVEQKETIMAVWSESAASRQGTRQLMQRAVR